MAAREPLVDAFRSLINALRSELRAIVREEVARAMTENAASPCEDPKPEGEPPLPLPLSVRPAEAARLIGVGRAKLYLLIAAGDLRPFKIGAATLLDVAELRAYLERQKAVGRSPALPPCRQEGWHAVSRRRR